MLGVPPLLVLAGSAYFAEGSLRAPAHTSADRGTAGAEGQDFILHAVDGAELHAWFLTPKEVQTGRCTLLLHGIADSRKGVAGFAPLFLEAGYSVLLPDSRGHGRSGGQFVTYGLIEKRDVREWISWMRLRGCREVYGFGESLGAAVLLQSAAGESALKAIVAECPFADLQSIAEYRVAQRLPGPSWLSTTLAKWIVGGGFIYARLRYGLDLRQASPLAAIRQTITPVLLIHGMADAATPPSHSERLAAAANSASLWLVPGANHTSASSTRPQEFRDRVLTWFATH